MAITGEPPVCGKCHTMYLDCRCPTYREKDIDQVSITLQRDFLLGAIELVRQNMGAADCVTCKRRWRVFMNALAVALRAGAGAGRMNERGAFIEEFVRRIEAEKEKGHAKSAN